MKIIQNISLLVLTVFVFTSCEDVIILDLKNTEPRIVIEANLDAQEQTLQVDVTLTNDFYDNSSPEQITDANITLTNMAGESQIVSLIDDGSYLLTGIEVEAGNKYELEVTTDEQTYIAEAFAPTPVEFVGIDTSYRESPFGGGFFYQCFFRWEDPENDENFYKVQAIVNDTIEGSSFYNDNGLDGELFIRPLMAAVDKGDEVEFQLININEGQYDFFLELESSQNGGVTPFNPKGNFDNKALGYFGIRSTSKINIQF